MNNRLPFLTIVTLSILVNGQFVCAADSPDASNKIPAVANPAAAVTPDASISNPSTPSTPAATVPVVPVDPTAPPARNPGAPDDFSFPKYDAEAAHLKLMNAEIAKYEEYTTKYMQASSRNMEAGFPLAQLQQMVSLVQRVAGGYDKPNSILMCTQLAQREYCKAYLDGSWEDARKMNEWQFHALQTLPSGLNAFQGFISYQLGRIYLKEKKYSQAEDALKLALKLKSQDTRVGQGLKTLTKGDAPDPEADKWAKDSVDKNLARQTPEEKQAHAYLELCRKNGIKPAGLTASIYFSLGEVYAGQSKNKLAQEFIDKAKAAGLNDKTVLR